MNSIVHTAVCLIEVESAFSFEDTVRRLEKAIGQAKLRVFARIDRALGARKVGLQMEATLLIVHGHRAGGSPSCCCSPVPGWNSP